jgi:hypothetical protein
MSERASFLLNLPGDYPHFLRPQIPGKKPNLSREFHEFSRIGFYYPCELAKFAAKCSGFGALNDGYGLVGNHQNLPGDYPHLVGATRFGGLKSCLSS